MTGPDVTVLLSTFNGERHLDAQLASLGDQAGVDWKLHHRDDGSTDRSVAMVEAWMGGASSSEHRRLADGHCGVVASYLHLLGSVDTPFFAFCDQDDVWYPHKLRWTLDALRSRGGADDVLAQGTDTHLVGDRLERRHDSGLVERGVRRGSQPSFGELLLLNAVTGATFVGTRALAAEVVRLASPRHPAMHDWFAALVASAHDGLQLTWAPTMAHRRHPHATTGTSAMGRERLALARESGAKRRTGIVSRACSNAEPLLWADDVDLGVSDRRALEQLMATSPGPTTRRDVLRLAGCGAKIWPTTRLLSLMR